MKHSKPVMGFQWHITDQCDQRCKHCYIFGEDPRKILYVKMFQDNEEPADSAPRV